MDDKPVINNPQLRALLALVNCAHELGLSTDEIVLLQQLNRYRFGNNKIHPTQETLARGTGFQTTKRVARAKSRLRKRLWNGRPLLIWQAGGLQGHRKKVCFYSLDNFQAWADTHFTMPNGRAGMNDLERDNMSHSNQGGIKEPPPKPILEEDNMSSSNQAGAGEPHNHALEQDNMSLSNQEGAAESPPEPILEEDNMSPSSREDAGRPPRAALEKDTTSHSEKDTMSHRKVDTSTIVRTSSTVHPASNNSTRKVEDCSFLISEEEKPGSISKEEKETDPRVHEFITYAADSFHVKFGAKLMIIVNRDGQVVERMLGTYSLVRLKHWWDLYLQDSTPSIRSNGRSIHLFYSILPRYISGEGADFADEEPLCMMCGNTGQMPGKDGQWAYCNRCKYGPLKKEEDENVCRKCGNSGTRGNDKGEIVACDCRFGKMVEEERRKFCLKCGNTGVYSWYGNQVTYCACAYGQRKKAKREARQSA